MLFPQMFPIGSAFTRSPRSGQGGFDSVISHEVNKAIFSRSRRLPCRLTIKRYLVYSSDYQEAKAFMKLTQKVNSVEPMDPNK